MEQALREAPKTRQQREDFMATLTPKDIVKELDNYIIGQDKAKRAVAIALAEVLQAFNESGECFLP